MKDAIAILERLSVTVDQFCRLAAIERDDFFASTEGAAIIDARADAILKLLRYCGKAKLKPILTLIDQEPEPREWRRVPYFPAYEVSNDGYVRRSSSSRKGSLRTLKPVLKGGYHSVTLYRGHGAETQRVHRLVCLAFQGDAPIGRPFVCHRDGTKTNNQASNLYWGSASDNAADWQLIRRERIKNAVHRPYTPEWRRQQRAIGSMTYGK